MIKLICNTVSLSLLSLLSVSVLAQNNPILTGCVNSPENPTVVLGLLGVVAAGVPRLLSRMKKRAP